MVPESAKEVQIATQAMGCYRKKYKAAPNQEQTTVSGKRKCFACKETSHTLDECRIKVSPSLTTSSTPLNHTCPVIAHFFLQMVLHKRNQMT